MSTLITSPFIIGLGMVVLLYLIWIIMSAIGLKGVNEDKPIKEIRQEAGLSLLGLALLSGAILVVYYVFLKTPTTVPLPS